jgi:hypothetical protein
MELSQTSATDLALAWSSIFAAVGTVGAFVVGGWVLFRQVRRDRAYDRERSNHDDDSKPSWSPPGLAASTL